MKLIFLILLFSPIAGFSHEMHTTPRWVRDHLNDESVISSRLHSKPISFSIKAYDSSDVQEQIAGYGIKPKTIRIASTLLKSKRVRVLDHLSGHEWDYCAGLFKCEYPKTNMSFNIWVLLEGLKANADPEKVAKRIVNSEKWAGVVFRYIDDSELFIIDNALGNAPPIKVDGKFVHFNCSSCIYLDKYGSPVIEPLPYRSYIPNKGSNGLIEYWWPYSSRYLVTAMPLTIGSGYGDRVTDVRIFFYDVKNKKMASLPLTLNVKNLAKQAPLKMSSGKKVHIVTEALERPIKIFSLRDGKRALKIYLPRTQSRKAGEFLLIPNFKN